MKTYLIVILLTVLLVSCAAKSAFLPGYIHTAAFDYSKYSELGFLITPYQYRGDYEAKGFITISVMPTAELKMPKQPAYPAAARNAGSELGMYIPSQSVWDIGPLNMDVALDSLYQKAVGMGADAIVDFKISFDVVKRVPRIAEPIVGYELSGFAIKRLGAFKP